MIVEILGQKEWGIHSLRHRKASLWSNEGKPLYELMILLGHKNLSTTQKNIFNSYKFGNDLATNNLENIENLRQDSKLENH